MRSQLRALLARFSRKRSIGLVLADDSVSISQVVHTSLGPVEVDRQTIQTGQDPIENITRRLLEPIVRLKEWRGAAVAVGLPFPRVLFLQRAVSPVQKDVSAEALLHESLQFTSILVDDLAADVERVGPIACIVAARRRYLESLLEALGAAGVRPYTVEPAPFGLLRVAAKAHPAPPKPRTALRIFLGADHGLAVLARGARPLAWRAFPVTPHAEAASVVSAVRALRPTTDRVVPGEPFNTILIHGRPELAGLVADPGWEPGLTIRHVHGPALDDQEAALGVAVGCHQEDDGFNLARELRPQGSLASLFPWGQALVEAALLAAATAVISSQYIETSTQAEILRRDADQHEWLGKRSIADLEKEKKELSGEIESLGWFLQSRYCWTRFTREVAARLPGSMTLTSLTGKNAFTESPGKKSSANARLLAMEIQTQVPTSGSDPKDLDALLRGFREAPFLKDSLPVLKLSPVKWSEKASHGRAGKSVVAEFSLTCEPPAKSSARKGQ